jgi:hypothetical protein
MRQHPGVFFGATIRPQIGYRTKIGISSENG